MKKFSCGDIIPGCQAVFQGVDSDSILKQVAKHAAEDHGLTQVPPEIVAQVEQKIREQ